MKRVAVYVLIFFFVVSCKNDNNQEAETPVTDADIKTRVVKSGLSFPWEIKVGPDNVLWVTERNGRVSRINPQNGETTILLTLPDVKAMGEGGLLGLALHPDFVNNPQVFLVYNYDKNGRYTEKVVRYSYQNNTLSNPQLIFDNIPAANNHNGSRLLITADLKLLITTGDALTESAAQNLSSLSGKILRLNLDGSLPADNPFAGSPVWSYGHRNAQGLISVSNKVYETEHGPDSDDELNIIEKGKNYGWPNIKGFCNTNEERTFCNANGIIEPIKAYTPTLAVSSITYYNQDLIPQWKNSILMANLKASKLVQLKLNADGTAIESETDFFANEFGRLRAVCASPDGKVYISTSNGNNDQIIEVSKN